MSAERAPRWEGVLVGHWKRWLLPALVTVIQLCWWPGSAVPRGTFVAPAPAIAVTTGTLAIGCALFWRRERPVVVTLVISGVLVVVDLTVRDRYDPLTAVQDLPLMITPLIALFNLGKRCAWRTAVLASAGVTVLGFAPMPATTGLRWQDVIVLPFGMIPNLAVAWFGRRRGQWATDRREAEHRLAAARRAGIDATTAERRRLARELHDEASHHLTAIVIDASTAQMLGGERPEVLREALDRAGRTSGDTLTMLGNLVDVLPFADMPAPSLTGLADDFRLLGQAVEVQLPIMELPRPAAEAAYGIAREALTNTLRYAPGGTVRMHLSYDGERAELIVEDDGRRASAPAAAGLGGGNGLTGMRERAQALGGSLEAGPRPEGGWRVRAVLPAPSGRPRQDPAPSPPTAGRRVIAAARSRVAMNAYPLLLVLALPLALIISHVVTRPAAGAALLTPAVIGHAVPLLWRRRRPGLAFIAVTLTLLPAVLLSVAGAVPPEYSTVLWALIPVDLFALYSLAAWGRRPALTWLGIPVAFGSTSLVNAARWATLEALPEDEQVPAFLSAILIMFLLTLFNPIFVWLAGYLVWRHRDRRRKGDKQVEAALARAAELTRDERDRFADGLRGAVLQHIAEVQAAAGREDLPAVIAAARSALAAMRVLLAGAARAGVPTSPPVASPVTMSPPEPQVTVR